MFGVLSLLSFNWLITLLLYIFWGILLFVITYRYSYIVNVIIYALTRILMLLFAANGMGFGTIILGVISNILVAFVVVYVAQALRYNFEYESSVWYILIVSVVTIIAASLISGIMSIFV